MLLRQTDEPGAGEGLVGGLSSLAAMTRELNFVSLVSAVRRRVGKRLTHTLENRNRHRECSRSHSCS